MTGRIDGLFSRRNLITGAAATVCLPRAPVAQERKIPVLGWLSSDPGSNPLLELLRAELRGLGYFEGRTIRVEARSAPDSKQLRALAQQLVHQQVDVIVTNGRAATRAAQEATSTVPIVMAPVDDPYEFVASLARPSGNITGLALQQTEIDAKQIEMLKELVPSISKLAIFYHYGETYYALESMAHKLGIEVLWIETKGTGDVERSFAEALARKANGLLIVDTGAFGADCDTIAAMALAHRLPAAASWRSDVPTRLLLTYAADNANLQQRAASYIDRLLKGAKANDLPVEQASKFDLIVNLKVAKDLGVMVPPSFLIRANAVID